MNLKLFLLFAAALLMWILLSKVYMLLYYWAALVAIVIFLHTRSGYKKQPYKWLNLLFFLYMLFIVWERTRGHKFAETPELIINDAEHILFAVIISLLIALLLGMYPKNNYTRLVNIVITVAIFNIIGVINECFQNMLAARPLFVFIPDSKKDLLMNVIGSVVFVLLALLFWKRKTTTLTPADDN